MQLKDCYDRVLLVVFGLVALVIGALLTKKALALPDQYARTDGSNPPDFGPSGLAQATDATEHLEKDLEWTSATMPGVPQKELRALVSVPVWVKDGREFDLLDPDTEKLRPPIDNAYIHEHNLPAGRADLATMDIDGDGFTNEREFLDGKTDPNDKSDHPEFSNKLRLAKIEVDKYTLEYRSSGGAAGEHGIRETTELFQGEAPRRRSHYKRVGDTFGMHPGHEDRYTITAHAPLEEPGKFGEMVPADELTIEDGQNPGNPFKLKLKGKHEVPTHHAVLYYGLPSYDKDLDGAFKVGDTFELPNQPGIKYEVLELTGNIEDGVKIRKLPAGGSPAKDFHVPAK